MLQCQCGGSGGAGAVAIRGESDGGPVRVAGLEVQCAGQVFEVRSSAG